MDFFVGDIGDADGAVGPAVAGYGCHRKIGLGYIGGIIHHNGLRIGTAVGRRNDHYIIAQISAGGTGDDRVGVGEGKPVGANPLKGNTTGRRTGKEVDHAVAAQPAGKSGECGHCNIRHYDYIRRSGAAVVGVNYHEGIHPRCRYDRVGLGGIEASWANPHVGAAGCSAGVEYDLWSDAGQHRRWRHADVRRGNILKHRGSGGSGTAIGGVSDGQGIDARDRGAWHLRIGRKAAWAGPLVGGIGHVGGAGQLHRGDAAGEHLTGTGIGGTLGFGRNGNGAQQQNN